MAIIRRCKAHDRYLRGRRTKSGDKPRDNSGLGEKEEVGSFHATRVRGVEQRKRRFGFGILVGESAEEEER